LNRSKLGDDLVHARFERLMAYGNTRKPGQYPVAEAPCPGVS